MKSLAISVAFATLFCQLTYAQLTIEPFTDACINGDLYQVVSGELIEYNFNTSCEFIGTTICEEYTDVNSASIDLTSYNSLGFNEADGLLYGLTKNRELVVIGSNCVAEIKGRPIIEVADDAPCANVSDFPNTFSATFDNLGDALVLDNSRDILYRLNVSSNIAEECIQLELNGGSVPTIADIAYDAENDQLIGIKGDDLYEINQNTGEVTSKMITGITPDDVSSNVGSIFGVEDGTIIAFYNKPGNYYEIDPETGVASFLANTASNSSNDGTSCSQVNIFCPDPLEGEAIPSCFDGNGDPANAGEYYIYLTTNYDPNNLSVTSATPDFTVVANGDTETTTYDGESELVLGPYSAESVIIEIKETDDGNLETKDYCVDVLEVIQVDEIPCANVPVELLRFDGELVKEKVYLFWETASEINNDYFVVERSIDAKHFIPIGKVKGKGNSLSKVSYSFQEELSSGKHKDYYYRLKQVDFNGTYEYSQSITVQIEIHKSDIKIFPSPVKDILQIISGEAIQKVRILDLSGKLVREINSERQLIFVSDLESGIYFLEVWQNRKRQLLRFVVQ
ncbi:MAG: T9SS type A sorting domain-containing protein [Bacteroidota bacterium]